MGPSSEHPTYSLRLPSLATEIAPLPFPPLPSLLPSTNGTLTAPLVPRCTACSPNCQGPWVSLPLVKVSVSSAEVEKPWGRWGAAAPRG